jgi:hypothetical protein
VPEAVAAWFGTGGTTRVTVMSAEHTMPWRRKFAWRPIWLHIEQPPPRQARMVWLRWYECRAEHRLPVPSVERELANRLLVIWAGTGVAVSALAVLTVLLLTGSRL